MSELQEVVCSFQPEDIRQYCCLDFDPSQCCTDEEHFPDLQLKIVLNQDERLSHLVNDLANKCTPAPYLEPGEKTS
jgi:hypothetical protein